MKVETILNANHRIIKVGKDHKDHVVQLPVYRGEPSASMLFRKPPYNHLLGAFPAESEQMWGKSWWFFRLENIVPLGWGLGNAQKRLGWLGPCNAF